MANVLRDNMFQKLWFTGNYPILCADDHYKISTTIIFYGKCIITPKLLIIVSHSYILCTLTEFKLQEKLKILHFLEESLQTYWYLSEKFLKCWPSVKLFATRQVTMIAVFTFIGEKLLIKFSFLREIWTPKNQSTKVINMRHYIFFLSDNYFLKKMCEKFSVIFVHILNYVKVYKISV